MSKYTEAIESLTCHGMALRYNPCDDEEEAKDRLEIMSSLKLGIEALQIADRLKQADISKINNPKLNFKGRKIIPKEEMGYRHGFYDGYNQALADIRGDTE